MNAGLVAVVAMGDLARSPRMVNHARELVANGFGVVLIGYRGREFEVPAGVRVRALEGGKSAPRGSSSIRFALTAGWRMGRLFIALVRALLREKPGAILMQNPPSFPTLTAVVLAAGVVGSTVVVDWHNYGFSLLALRFGNSHWLVRLARWYEFSAGRGMARHLCVSRAMREDLLRHDIRAEVLYDRPWRVAEVRERRAGGLVGVYPAGWTADEDIELLLDALELAPDAGVTVYITGEGTKGESLLARLEALCAKGALVVTGFLNEGEYHALIRRTNLGLSLHRSSSGLDLAMKVVDLFGGGLPVCALDYGGSIGEQIEDGATGFLFRTAQELAALFTRIGATPEMLDTMRDTVRERWPASWSEEWRRVALPLLRGEPDRAQNPAGRA